MDAFQSVCASESHLTEAALRALSPGLTPDRVYVSLLQFQIVDEETRLPDTASASIKALPPNSSIRQSEMAAFHDSRTRFITNIA